MKLIEASKVIVSPERQRRNFDLGELLKLGDSIASHSLMHAIVLRENNVLVAGERRLRTIKEMAELGVTYKYDGKEVPLGFIPYVELGELSAIAAEEAELEENVQRAGLTWQERAAAVARLMALRVTQAKQANVSPPSVAELSIEVRGSAEGENHQATKEELILARHLANPLIAGATTAKEAFKILRREEAATKQRELGASVGRTYSSNVHTLVHGDSFTWMRQCPPGLFDCILTDPPYGMGADEFGDSGGMAAGAHGYKDDEQNAVRCYESLATEGFRITKPQAHLYAFCDIDLFPRLKLIMFLAGWTVFRTPLIWYKRHGSRAPWPEQGPQRKFETILYAVKGKRPTLHLAGDVLDFPADTNLGHGAQKPVALLQELLRRSCLPGNTVLDPFAGTGSVLPAAHALKLAATAVEMDQASYGIAVGRLEALKLDQELGL